MRKVALGLFLVIANLYFADSVLFIYRDIDFTDLYNYATSSKYMKTKHAEIPLPVGVYVDNSEIDDEGDLITDLNNLNGIWLGITDYSHNNQCDSLRIQGVIKTIRCDTGDELISRLYTSKYLYNFEGSDVYLSREYSVYYPVGYLNFYAVFIPDKCTRITYMGRYTNLEELWNIIRTVIFEKEVGEFLFVKEIERLEEQ